MTYRMRGGRQFIVAATGGGEDAALVAFAIPVQASAGGIGAEHFLRGGK
jgi:hypothetical protein